MTGMWRKVAALVALGLGAGAAAGDVATDWPVFRGPERTGIAPGKGLNLNWTAKAPKELWRTPLGDGGYGGVCVVGAKVFLIDRDGGTNIVRALDNTTGKELWSHKYPDGYDSGNKEWGRGRSSPTFDNGKLYTQSAAGLLHCFDAETGKVLWELDIKAHYKGQQPGWGYTSAPLVDGEKLIVGPGAIDASVVALNKADGKELWRCKIDEKSFGYATPVLATLNGVKQYLVMTSETAAGIDAASGKLLWTYRWQTDYGVNGSDPVPVGKDHVFITSSYNKGGSALLKIDGAKATQVWEFRGKTSPMRGMFNAPVLVGEHLYGISGHSGEEGALVCIDLKTGQAVWKEPGFECGGVVVVEGHIIAVRGKTGEAVLAKATPAGFQSGGSVKPFPAGGAKAWTPPAVAQGKLFVRNQRELVVYDLK